jgi:hypothetical protein
MQFTSGFDTNADSALLFAIASSLLSVIIFNTSYFPTFAGKAYPTPGITAFEFALTVGAACLPSNVEVGAPSAELGTFAGGFGELSHPEKAKGKPARTAIANAARFFAFKLVDFFITFVFISGYLPVRRKVE